MSMVFNDYTLLHMSQNIVNLSGCYSNDLKSFMMVAYTIFQAHVTYVTLKIALNSQVNISNKSLFAFNYLHAGTGLCASFNKVYLFWVFI